MEKQNQKNKIIVLENDDEINKRIDDELKKIGIPEGHFDNLEEEIKIDVKNFQPPKTKKPVINKIEKLFNEAEGDKNYALSKVLKEKVFENIDSFYSFCPTIPYLNSSLPPNLETLFINCLGLNDTENLKYGCVNNLPITLKRVYLNSLCTPYNVNMSITDIEEIKKYFKLPFGCVFYISDQGRHKYSGDSTKRIKIKGSQYIPIKKMITLSKDILEVIIPELRISKKPDGDCYITFSDDRFNPYWD